MFPVPCCTGTHCGQHCCKASRTCYIGPANRVVQHNAYCQAEAACRADAMLAHGWVFLSEVTNKQHHSGGGGSRAVPKGQLALQPLPLQHQGARVSCSLERCSLLCWSQLKCVVLHSQRDRELCAAFAQDELGSSILMWKLKRHSGAL